MAGLSVHRSNHLTHCRQRRRARNSRDRRLEKQDGPRYRCCSRLVNPDRAVCDAIRGVAFWLVHEQGDVAVLHAFRDRESVRQRVHCEFPSPGREE